MISSLNAKNNLPLQFNTTGKKNYQQNFLTQFREKTIVKHIDEIALFFVENENVYFHTFDGKKYSLLKKLEYIESVCDPGQFFRINRQMLINRKAIIAFEPFVNRKVVLQLKVKINDKAVVSRLKVSPFKEWLEK